MPTGPPGSEPPGPTRGTDGTERGVSTAVDAALALLLISAALVVLGTAPADRQRLDAAVADRVAGTLSATTAGIEYSLSPVRRAPAFPNASTSASRFDRQRHGALPGLLASATMHNVTVAGRRLTVAGARFGAAVEGSTLEAVAPTGYDARVVAVWRPYENASVRSRLTVGDAPPADADVGTAVLRATSGVDRSGAAVQAAYDRRGRYGDAADVLAAAVVERYLPPAETQRALEGGRLGRALVVYRYRRLAWILDNATAGSVSFDPGDPADPLAGRGANASTPNASAANAAVAARLSDLIEADLRATFTRREMATGLADAVRIGQVRITVEVWKS